MDFTHADHIPAGFLQGVQYGFPGGRQGVIPPVGGAHEFPLSSSHIGPGNYPAHSPFFSEGQLPGDFTAAVELGKPHGLLIPADLQHGIPRGVDDEITRLGLMLPQLLQNTGAAGSPVAHNPASGAKLQFPNEFSRKTGLGKGEKRDGGNEPHQFPMPGHGVLADTFFFHPHGETDRLFRGGKPRLRAESGNSHTQQAGDGEPFRPVRNVPQCVCSRVAVGRCVVHCADPQGIQNQQENAAVFHRGPLVSRIVRFLGQENRLSCSASSPASRSCR